MQDKYNNIFSNSDCPSDDLLRRYHNKELSSKEMHAIEKHISECEMCSDMLEGMSMFADKEKANVIVSELKTELIANLNDNKKRKLTPFYKLSIAASIIVIVGIGILITQLTEKPTNELAVVTEKAKEEVAETTIVKDIITLKENYDTEEIVEVPAEKVELLDKTIESYNLEITEDEDNIEIIEIEEESEIIYEIDDMEMDEEAEKSSEVVEFYHINQPKGEIVKAYKAVENSPVVEYSETEEVVKVTPANNEQSIETVATKSNRRLLNRKKKLGKYRSVRFVDSDNSTKKDKVRSETVAPASNSITVPDSDISTNQDTSVEAYNLFENKNYHLAVEAYETILSEYPNDYKSLYNCGLSYYNLENYSKAISKFDVIINSSDTLYIDDAKWYKANSLIKSDKLTEAKEILHEITNSESNHKEEAEELLNELD